jgi:hypothetical protein
MQEASFEEACECRSCLLVKITYDDNAEAWTLNTLRAIVSVPCVPRIPSLGHVPKALVDLYAHFISDTHPVDKLLKEIRGKSSNHLQSPLGHPA